MSAAPPDVPEVPDVKARMALALDVPDLAVARDLARRLAPWFGIAKVGLELYASAGPAAFEMARDLGLRVFADLKLYDIPNTVEGAARALGQRGVNFLTIPAAGGGDMLRRGVAAFHEGARSAGHREPVALGVTVLTSDPDTDAFDDRLALARDAGCDGVVCATHEITRVAARGGLRTMVPGLRLLGGDHHDQARVATPGAAIGAGADWIVVGRAVTAAADPERTADAVAREVAEAVRPVRGSADRPG